jgi:hypothetical protein|tara:strand:+ start:26695 stop:27345 length:651 start_codon:yes stop_codon:yes gene_type:complete
MFNQSNCNKINNLCKYTKQSYGIRNFPNGEAFPAAYHTLNFGQYEVKGQRNNKIRFDIMKQHFDFKNKNIIDFGCNTGGLLMQLGKSVKSGIGLDYDPRCINCANALNSYYKYDLSFYVCDFDKHDINIVNNYIPSERKIDAVIVLSMGSWVKKWERLYTFASQLSDTMFYEANNRREAVSQLHLLKSLYTNVKIISEHSYDDPSNHGRQLYLFTR